MTFAVRPPQRPIANFSIVAGTTGEFYTTDYNATPQGSSSPSIIRFGAYRVVYLGNDGAGSMYLFFMADPPSFAANPSGMTDFTRLVITGTFNGGVGTLSVLRSAATSVLFDGVRAAGSAIKFALPAASATYTMVPGNTYQCQLT